jgi:hypothetical protein
VCEHCGGAVKIITCIQDKLTIGKILARPPRPPAWQQWLRKSASESRVLRNREADTDGGL